MPASPNRPFTLLHTSDWHLGHTLFNRKRHAEAAAFLNWLAETLEQENVDVLLVAGDVFDTAMPDTVAQKLYYEFLLRVFAMPGRQVVITGGNHDSSAFLNAPSGILQHLRVHVVGETRECLGDEILLLKDVKNADDSPLCVVAAVPFLRDRDLRAMTFGEDLKARERALAEGLYTHYARAGELAHTLAEAHGGLPVIFMGHLFAAGGEVELGDGMRELYVGSIAQAGSDLFPEKADYVALGHLHRAQIVNGKEHIRYSGTPLPMRVGESAAKTVTIVRFENGERTIRTLEVPQTQRMVEVAGDWSQIEQRLTDLKAENISIWVEVNYTGTEVISDLRHRVDVLVRGTEVEPLRVMNHRVGQSLAGQSHAAGTRLEELSVTEMFERRLDAGNVPEAQRVILRPLYGEIVRVVNEGLQQPEDGPTPGAASEPASEPISGA